MINSLYKTLPFLLPFILGSILIIAFDKKFNVVKKIDSMITIKQGWKPFLFMSLTIIVIMALMFLFKIIHLSQFNNSMYGILFAFGIYISNSLLPKKNKLKGNNYN